ncbi:preprotein translocase subunit SecE [Epilithonimonas hungarica]|uniref:DUF6585 family protein n=1 Tax=Epilithonimonas hungarica TaxID=454006 RepID=UPI002781E072|nr:DUF6585 family protein [Epilithonimonas hungarica]MDP9956463.1 preprotein translocase subunit SecE [Epilithonimonas hungarica]
MNNKLISKSKKSFTNTIIIISGIVLFSFFTYLLYNNFKPKNEYDETLKIIGFVVLVSVILYCIYYLINQKVISIYENHFEVKRLFQTKKYLFSEFKTHYSKKIKGKYNSWTEYYFILNTDEKLTLIDTEYSNFYDFYSIIRKNIKVNNELNSKLLQPNFLKYSIICGIISGSLIYLSSYFYDFKRIENSDFAYITSELKNEIRIIKGSKGKKHFELELTSQPNFEFKISGRSYNSIGNDNDFVKAFDKGDEIIIGIEKKEYEKKISKIKKLNLLDKYFKFSTIQVKQLKNKKGIFFIDLKEVNRLKTKNNYIAIALFSFFGLLFLYLTIGNYRTHIKSINKIKN